MASANGADHYRIALATQGTRGDFQPMLALACALRKAGHEVFILGNAGHVDSAKQFGMPGEVCCADAKDILNTEAGKRSMETGDLLAAFSGMTEDKTDYYPPAAEALAKFKPDLVLYSALIAGFCGRYRVEVDRHQTPFVPISYQPQTIPSNDFGPAPMFRLELEEGQPMLSKWVYQLQGMARGNEEAILKAKQEGAGPEITEQMDSAENLYFDMFKNEEHPVPSLMVFSEAFWSAPEDWPKSGVKILGRLCFSREEQDSKAREGASFFNVGEELQRCSEFIAKASPPVYIGWGSMSVNSAEHMARLAVEALKVAGQRGVIVGGWADLSATSLGSGPEAEGLVKFCEENVLFMKAAPHEWLFPQCACCVHHGGIGTVQASLGAGSPTIVTPVFADQHDIADRVTAHKWGLGTSVLPKLTAQELGEAIKRVCGDPTYKANVTKLAAAMAKEDGCANTVAFLEKVIREDGKTGKFAEKMAAYRAKIKTLRDRHQKFSIDQKLAVFSNELNKRYDKLRQWNEKSMEVFGTLVATCTKGNLWYVKGSRCLARAGEKLKSDEVGRFREFAFLEVLEQKGSRLHAKLLKGVGPAEGWVSTEVKGVEIVAKVKDMAQISAIVQAQFRKVFADVFPEEDSGSTVSRALGGPA